MLLAGERFQKLPLYNDALLSAIEDEMDGTKTWVMSQEHLMAIAVRTWRRKDFSRLEHVVSLGTFDEEYLARNTNQAQIIFEMGGVQSVA